MTFAPLTRRSFLAGAGSAASALALLGAAPALPRLRSAIDTSAAATGAFARALPVPDYLTDADIHLTAAEADVQILPGQATRMWAFNGQFPGPIIKRPAGQTTRVHVTHALPEEVGSLSIHHHGNHSASAEDGQPGRHVIEPGESRTYTYELMEDGVPERGAFQWYHDHSHYRTGRNTWMGLVGGFIITDEHDDALPGDDRDVPLIITDREFDADNQLVDRFTAPGRENATAVDALTGSNYPPADEGAGVGATILTNGVPQPHLEVEPGRYRFRILNASNFRPYNLRLSNGATLTQVATESGLLPQPLERTEVLLGPAERVEVVVDFSGMAGSDVVLESVPRTSGIIPVTGAAVGQVMQFRVGTTAVDEDQPVPTDLRAMPEWVGELSEQVDRIWAFGLGTDEMGRTAWTINGRVFNHDRIDAHPELGTTETWMLVNTTPLAISHYIHIHDVDWKVLSRNGAAPEPGEDALKETFRLDPGEVVVVGSKFTDHLGPYMLHCHMLEHEDHGMMTNFEVVEPGTAPPVPIDPLARLEPAEQQRVTAVLNGCHDGRPAPMDEWDRLPLPRIASADNPYFCDLEGLQ